MVRKRGASEVVTRGGISEPSYGITNQTSEATSEPKSGYHTASSSASYSKRTLSHGEEFSNMPCA